MAAPARAIGRRCMATCEYERHLSAFHDGELPAGLAAEMERHLEACQACRDELRRLKGISSFISASVDTQYVPDEAMRQWRGCVRPARDQTVLRMTHMLSAVAAAVLILCSAVLWQHWQGRTDRVAQSTAWESAAVRTASPRIRGLAGQLTGNSEASADVQLANSILADQSGRRNQP